MEVQGRTEPYLKKVHKSKSDSASCFKENAGVRTTMSMSSLVVVLVVLALSTTASAAAAIRPTVLWFVGWLALAHVGAVWRDGVLTGAEVLTFRWFRMLIVVSVCCEGTEWATTAAMRLAWGPSSARLRKASPGCMSTASRLTEAPSPTPWPGWLRLLVRFLLSALHTYDNTGCLRALSFIGNVNHQLDQVAAQVWAGRCGSYGFVPCLSLRV